MLEPLEYDEMAAIKRNFLKPYCDFFGVVASFTGVVLSFNEFSSKSLVLAFETFLLNWKDFP